MAAFEVSRLVVKRSNFRLQSFDKVLILVIRLIVALAALVNAISRLHHEHYDWFVRRSQVFHQEAPVKILPEIFSRENDQVANSDPRVF